MFYFADWGYLFLLILIPLLIWFYQRYGRRQEATLRYPTLQILKNLSHKKARIKVATIQASKLLGLMLLIFALARPQKGSEVREYSTEGIDIMLVLDISTSMKAVDFKPNRLEAAKTVARKFIDGRHNDRIGLTVFAAESFLQCPLTIDYGVLKELVRQVDFINEKYDGTAIGIAIANATNRLRESQAKSRVMILLSDGRNNAGAIDPRTAAQMAAAFDIKIYTIGAGKLGQAPYPVTLPGGYVQYQLMDVEIDEELLTAIAQMTGGKYFRATDEKSLSTIYEEISNLEKTEIKVKDFVNYSELYHYFLLPAILLLSFASIMELVVWRRLP